MQMLRYIVLDVQQVGDFPNCFIQTARLSMAHNGEGVGSSNIELATNQRTRTGVQV